MVVTCIVPREEGAIDANAVRRFLKERLASYKVPRCVLLMREEEVAVTGNGKITAAELRQLVEQRVNARSAGLTSSLE